jgi:acyl-CoA thioester hydrolase
MIHTTHTIRVRYGETDPMKYVYYGNYAEYFEIGRVELFRSIGMSYDEIENQGIWLPVSEYKIKYLKPALYDQELEIHTFIKKFFLDAKMNKIIKCPDALMKLIEENWKS